MRCHCERSEAISILEKRLGLLRRPDEPGLLAMTRTLHKLRYQHRNREQQTKQQVKLRRLDIEHRNL